MTEFFTWLENTPVSLFMREDFYAYFVLLIFHALGMAFVVGGGIAVGLRTAGVARSVPLEKFAAFFPWMWFGAVLAVISGVGLLLGYPAKALTNPIFALKFACLIGAALLTRRISRRYMALSTVGEPVPAEARRVGIAAIALWLAGVAGGKLLLYTNSVLLVSNEW
ncbi:MAG TPA: hypothetical protein VLA37_09180 [Sphingomonadaceae bacterium]|nr:hypothetical protein [Sphingomonadaceae bacterium]